MNKHTHRIIFWVCSILISASSAGCGRPEQTGYQPAETVTIQPNQVNAITETAIVRPTHFAYAEQTGEAIQTLQAVREQAAGATVRASGWTPVSLPTATFGPTPEPRGAKKLQKGSFLMTGGGQFDMYVYAQGGWSYDLPDGTQLEVVAGGDMTDGTGMKVYYRHPEAQQGLLLVRHLSNFDTEMGTFKVQERRFELPKRDGAAYILDGRVDGERMLLTVKSFAGALYAFDVNQGTFSEPQPPSLSIDGPSTLDDGTLVIEARGYDPAGVLLEYMWDLDGDGTFEVRGQTATLPSQMLDGRSTHTITARVTSTSGLSTTTQTSLRMAAATPTSNR